MFKGAMFRPTSDFRRCGPGFSTGVGVMSLACLMLCSCQTRKNLADFGNVKVSEFAAPTTQPAAVGQTGGASKSAQTNPSPTTLASQGAVRKPVVPTTDPVVQMARARAADASIPAPTTVAYRPTAATQLAPAMTNQVDPSTIAAYRKSIPKEFVVKTTAYTHTEADSLQYGTKSATGDNLKFGYVRSAAADWSRYPVGTKFKIKGLPYQYVVDDYGSALVGTDTIDLYKPNHGTMDQWGARNVGIEVLEWGSFEESKRILESRKHKPGADHVRQMLNNIEQKIRLLPPVLRDGFRA